MTIEQRAHDLAILLLQTQLEPKSLELLSKEGNGNVDLGEMYLKFYNGFLVFLSAKF